MALISLAAGKVIYGRYSPEKKAILQYATLVNNSGFLGLALVEAANRLYLSLPSHDRDDAMAMQYLIPDWKYDSKMPCLVK